MDTEEHVATLEEVMDRVVDAGRDREAVTVDDILSAVGERSFGPLLLLVGLIVLAPIIGDIPGVPTVCALMVFVFAIQLMLHKEHFWLPGWMLRRSVRTRTLNKAVDLSRKPARFIDRLVKPRLTFLIRGYVQIRCVALATMAVALMMPAMEFIPFSANLAGAVLTLFGLALISRDGVLALLAFTLTGASALAVVYGIWG